MAISMADALSKTDCGAQLQRADLERIFLLLASSLLGGGMAALGPDSATVGVASAELLSVNPERRGLILVNDSSNVIYLAFGVPAEIGKGIRLNPNGGSFTMTGTSFSNDAVFGIATGAGSNLAIQEFE